MSWVQQRTDCVCPMPTTTSIFPSQGSSQGSSQGPSFKRLVSTSYVSTTSDKKRKVGGPPYEEPPIAQKKTVATLLNSPSATNIESNGPWFTSLKVPTQAEAGLKSLNDVSRMDRPRDSKRDSDESISPASRPQTSAQRQKPRIEYREATKVLQKLDKLSIATSRMQSMIEDIKKTTEDIDAIMGVETTSFPRITAQLKDNYQDLITCYEERLTILTQWSGDANISGEKEKSTDCMV
ncbi:hypothetical protein DER45DRAFT_552662 [Fusarium avenaceum]|nr:hypothetical protein DER45DRAFT_552662 [Fusarium avenaceum]